MEEVRRHCERCCDEKDEPTQVQEKRIQEHEKRKQSPGGVDRRRSGGHGGQGTKGWREGDEEQGQRAGIVLGIRKVTGTSDGNCVRKLHTGLGRGSGSRASAAWKILRSVFLKKPGAKLEKRIREFRAIALMSMLAKWYAAVVVGLLQEEEEPVEWRRLHVGTERRVSCEHLQAPLTNVQQKGWVGSGILQVPCNVPGQPGCANGLRCGPTFDGNDIDR